MKENDMDNDDTTRHIFYLNPRTGERRESGDAIMAALEVQTPMGSVDVPMIVLAAIRGGAPFGAVTGLWGILIPVDALPHPMLASMVIAAAQRAATDEQSAAPAPGLRPQDLN